ncbi:hypothetical protein K443DRAFT_347121 [Laccaria amethystina LaAM-08-1]|uniref:Uncharacterized protein n=1 Tax=Laccaria amethystina LaAM-08-1 TaxID=1095629 RepID=A0A0C9WJL2_9AGAR|nr:hypothetical protein K443DRAFT_347121 [Laccaria amethystina LaAM-08-1]
MTLRVLPYPMSSESPTSDQMAKPTSLFRPTPARPNHDCFKTTVWVMSLMSKSNVTSLGTSQFNDQPFITSASFYEEPLTRLLSQVSAFSSGSGGSPDKALVSQLLRRRAIRFMSLVSR